MNPIEKIEAILQTEIQPSFQFVDEEETCFSLIYSIYFLVTEFSQLFNVYDDNYKNLKGILISNYINVNNGGDNLMVFYYMNKELIKGTKFNQFFENFLKMLEKNLEVNGDMACGKIYKHLYLKMKKFEEVHNV